MKVYNYSPAVKDGKSNVPQGWLERRILGLLSDKLEGQNGSLKLTLPSGFTQRFGQGEPFAAVRLYSFKPLLRLIFGGINGWSESYLAKEWDSPDLTALVRWALNYEQALESISKAGFCTGLLHNLYHWQRDNSRNGSRKNIAAHYDLGNDFYRHWLDPSMTYSSALFSEQGQDLHQAQQQKYQRILELLDPADSDHLVEIGCGWGGFAEHATRHRELKLDAITLSKEQLSWAQQKMTDADLDNRCKMSLTDYRDLNQSYDGVVSIEMFEAVGEAHWDTYFQTLDRILKPQGKAVLQIITIDNQRFHSYRKQADFIQRYVFPGGMLPSIEILQDKIAEHGFHLRHQQLFGRDYALTLEHWRRRFEAAWDEIKHLGFDETFYRLWRYYLSYCQGGFQQGSLNVGLYVLERNPVRIR
ncbi:MAG: cyclopropane-fatty-acyl-phospholipid synthase family protein [Motiliproteus sp.]|nr:cyclopropane-fatty-acyl-phospholipid synthase family protein [Motiliproteus sp.]MCW9053778.1 cyclopropane-fatty-acyl-phospholipid synthase family protein [Motiliproteus sp.]